MERLPPDPDRHQFGHGPCTMTEHAVWGRLPPVRLVRGRMNASRIRHRAARICPERAEPGRLTELVAQCTPPAAPERTSATICRATAAGQVGWPCWSLTTSTVGRWPYSPIMMRTKWRP
jgi:hypothetical protein